MTAYIKSAYFGDEQSMRNITSVINDKILGTSIDVDVNEKLIPPFVVADKTELSPLDVKKIREQAANVCGGVDQDCINSTEASLRQEKLRELEMKANSSANVIKGRRLTVNYVDETGKLRRAVIPDGQKFKLDNLSITNPKKGMQVPPMEYIRNQMYLLGGLIFSTFVYVFGVAATFTVFYKEYEYMAIPLVVISFFVPYSGYFMIFLFYMLRAAANTYVGSQ